MNDNPSENLTTEHKKILQKAAKALQARHEAKAAVAKANLELAKLGENFLMAGGPRGMMPPMCW
jgi:hypothetical protein